MEFGPRALGNRSIVGDARSPKMQSIMNLKIKFRESFRPFAPSVLEERIGDYFDLDRPSPYMLLVAPVREERRIAAGGRRGGAGRPAGVGEPAALGRAGDHPRRLLGAHPDGGRRHQPALPRAAHRAFEALTGCGLIINTSFNVRGEPIVCTPEDAYRCFMRTEMDYLVLEDFLLAKTEQPAWEDRERWQETFALD